MNASGNAGKPDIDTTRSKCPVPGCSFKSKASLQNHYLESHEEVNIEDFMLFKIKLFVIKTFSMVPKLLNN